MQFLRMAFAQQAQLLGVMHQMIARLEAQQLASEAKLNERLDGIIQDIGDIKTSLNGHFKPGT